MPRPAGARNHDFEEKRAALLDTLTKFALTADLRRPSLRQFALAANQSEPTLRHYFGDRQGLVIEILENIRRYAMPLWISFASPAPDTDAALDDYFRLVDEGLEHGWFARAHAFGLIEGLADDVVGRAYLEKLLEPALLSISDKLRVTPGGPRSEDGLRASSLAVLSPLLIMSIHQDLLGGETTAPINMHEVIRRLRGGLGRGLRMQTSAA